MIDSDDFVKALQGIGVDFFTGVPDTILGGIIADLTEKRLYTPAVREDEAVAMAGFLKFSGISEDRIMTDSQGVNTLESVRYIAKNFPTETKIIVVSQFFHIPRAVLALRKAGFKNVSGAAVPPKFWRDIYSTAREVPALFIYACCRAL